jgi:hypothetical protein
VINVLFFSLLILNSHLQAMNAEESIQVGSSSPNALTILEQTMQAKVQRNEFIFEETFALIEMQTKLFDEALLRNNKFNIYSLLVDGNISIGGFGMNETKESFGKATKEMQSYIVEEIAQNGHGSSGTNKTRLLWILASLGNTELIKQFFKRWTEDKCKKYLNEKFHDIHSPLSVAAREGHREAVNYFIDKGAQLDLSPNNKGNTALYRTLKYAAADKEKMVDCLLVAFDLARRGANVGLHPMKKPSIVVLLMMLVKKHGFNKYQPDFMWLYTISYEQEYGQL